MSLTFGKPLNALEVLNYIDVEVLHWETVSPIDDETAAGRVLALLDLRDYVQMSLVRSM